MEMCLGVLIIDDGEDGGQRARVGASGGCAHSSDNSGRGECQRHSKATVDKPTEWKNMMKVVIRGGERGRSVQKVVNVGLSVSEEKLLSPQLPYQSPTPSQ